MDKKLPSVFANKISKSSSHNNTISYTSYKEENYKHKEENYKQNDLRTAKKEIRNVNQKINDIFSSTRYVYKADVNIKLKNETIKRKIIGKNSVHLITIDNELIPIGDIVDIEFAD